MATQDIAVDGWALTMLSRDNVGYGSVCNSIGQLFGVFIANQGFIALSDPKWCHNYLGLTDNTSLVTLDSFMHFWGYVFIITTIWLWFFKKEIEPEGTEHPEGLLETCRQVYSICKLPAVQTLVLILLTCKVSFMPVDSAFTFKLQEYGMPKSTIATISPLLLLCGLLTPIIASDAVSNRPLNTFSIGLPIKIVISVAVWIILQYTRIVYLTETEPHWHFYGSLMVVSIVNEFASNIVFISLMSFFSKVSDPSIGGSYMTLLNTFTNLGAKWPNVLSLWLIPKLTFSKCSIPNKINEFFTT